MPVPNDWWLTPKFSVRLCCRVYRVKPHAVLQVQQGPSSSACRGRKELAGAWIPPTSMACPKATMIST